MGLTVTLGVAVGVVVAGAIVGSVFIVGPSSKSSFQDLDAVECRGGLVGQLGVVGNKSSERLAIRGGGSGQIGKGFGSIVAWTVLVMLDGSICMIARGGRGLLLLV